MELSCVFIEETMLENAILFFKEKTPKNSNIKNLKL